MIEEATCPVCNNGLSAHEDGTHPAYVERCFLCRQPDPGVLVVIEGTTRLVCDRCWHRSTPDIPVSYMREEAEGA